MEIRVDYLVVALAWLFGGFVGAATGVGGVMTAMPLLTLALFPADAVLVACLVGVFGALQLTVAYRRFCSWKDLRELVFGAVFGCVAGAWVLKAVSVQSLQFMVCAMIALFVIMQMFPRLSGFHLSESPAWGVAAGVVSGFVNSSVAMVGIPLGIYALLKHWTPDRSRGNMSVFYLLSGVVTVCIQAGMGLYTQDILKASLAGMAGVFLGGVLGIRAGRRIDQKLFRRAVLAFLILAAAILFMRAARM